MIQNLHHYWWQSYLCRIACKIPYAKQYGVQLTSTSIWSKCQIHWDAATCTSGTWLAQIGTDWWECCWTSGHWLILTLWYINMWPHQFIVTLNICSPPMPMQSILVCSVHKQSRLFTPLLNKWIPAIIMTHSQHMLRCAWIKTVMSHLRTFECSWDLQQARGRTESTSASVWVQCKPLILFCLPPLIYWF